MHHVREWNKYNKQLVNRGKINFWINPEIFKKWKARKEKKNGHPIVYSEEVIKAMCYIRFKFHLSLRETEGFFLSLLELTKTSRKVPSYTQLCRRMKKLNLPQEFIEKRGVTDIVLDTTGLKAYGEGEWRAKKYGSRRSWKKLHLALDPESGKLVLAELTEEHVHDTAYLEKALKKANRKQGKVLIDGIADSRRCYELTEKYNKELLTPPKKGAVIRQQESYKRRNDAIKIIHALGGDRLARTIWAKLVGYNRRSLAESMMSRWKRLYGGNLRSHCEERKRIEVSLKAEMINKMIDARAA